MILSLKLFLDCSVVNLLDLCGNRRCEKLLHLFSDKTNGKLVNVTTFQKESNLIISITVDVMI